MMTTDGLKTHPFAVALRSTADTPFGAANPVLATPHTPSCHQSEYVVEYEAEVKFLTELIAGLEANELTLDQIHAEPLSWQLIENLHRIDQLEVILHAAKKELAHRSEILEFARCTDEESLRRIREVVQKRTAATRLGEIRQLIADLNLFDNIEHCDHEIYSQVTAHKGTTTQPYKLTLLVSLSSEAAPYNNPVRPFILGVTIEVGETETKHLIPRRAVTFETLKQTLDDFAAGYRAASADFGL